MCEENTNSLGGWFWFGISHEVTFFMLVWTIVFSRLDWCWKTHLQGDLNSYGWLGWCWLLVPHQMDLSTVLLKDPHNMMASFPLSERSKGEQDASLRSHIQSFLQNSSLRGHSTTSTRMWTSYPVIKCITSVSSGVKKDHNCPHRPLLSPNECCTTFEENTWFADLFGLWIAGLQGKRSWPCPLCWLWWGQNKIMQRKLLVPFRENTCCCGCYLCCWGL